MERVQTLFQTRFIFLAASEMGRVGGWGGDGEGEAQGYFVALFNRTEWLKSGGKRIIDTAQHAKSSVGSADKKSRGESRKEFTERCAPSWWHKFLPSDAFEY